MTISSQKRRYAKKQRKSATAGERRLRIGLWIIGYSWQKYDPIGYLPDFVSDIWCVAIEVDGGIHNRPDVKGFDRDKARRRMSQARYHTVRITDRAAKDRPIEMIAYVVLVSVAWRVLRFIFYK